ncbi:ATP-dependent RNA helicase DDX1-like [Hylaeus volcanicus]|uniref:ATP-dependent RNA helicase DDX1-like n=1 Tax=Hylaeus volcanicus TaxID=313075 RepID=UPI0023B85649|nr:ATP-dependent RNA helicase DDX1-like [Hylaeus volcanicus]XP_053991025.1 ATP-dependent RNA helicase DDX1-like [Hylaeus volcanicus]
MADFERLGVCPDLIVAIQSYGWNIPTAVQDETIPLILGGGDVCVAAETGSGKTGAFAISCAQLVHESSAYDKKKNERDKDINVTIENDGYILSSTEEEWNGVKFNCTPLNNIRMYEVSILSTGLVRVGWATRLSRFDIGQDNQSFGYGGSGKKSHCGNFTYYGNSFTKDDIIGCIIEGEKNTISFTKNGHHLGVAFEIPSHLEVNSLFPAVCGKNFKAFVRLHSPFIHPIQNISDISPSSIDCIQIVKDTIHKRPSKDKTFCMILSPTRELADQTYNVMKSFVNVLKNPPISCALLIGGSGNQRISESLKQNGTNIVVGCLGKISYAIQAHVISASFLQYLVLDEADELILQNTTKPILEIKNASKMPRVQTLFFSASLGLPNVRHSIDVLTTNSTWVNLKEELGIPETVHVVQYIIDPHLKTLPCSSYIVSPHIAPPTDNIHSYHDASIQLSKEEIASQTIKLRKPQIAVAIANALQMDNCLIFCRTNLDCDNFEHYLITLAKERGVFTKYSETGVQNPYSCVVLSGSRHQSVREKNLKAFKKGEARFLICTDVAARGLDIDSLPFTIMLNTPDNPSLFIHRLGRVGRFDKMGFAVVLVSNTKEKVWYHTCANRGIRCENRDLVANNGCCVWYEETHYLKLVEGFIGQKIPCMDTSTFSVDGILEFYDTRNLTVVESEQEEWLSTKHEEDLSKLQLKRKTSVSITQPETFKLKAHIYGKTKAESINNYAEAQARELEPVLKVLQDFEKCVQKLFVQNTLNL